jgi:hypothetical protein
MGSASRGDDVSRRIVSRGFAVRNDGRVRVGPKAAHRLPVQDEVPQLVGRTEAPGRQRVAEVVGPDTFAPQEVRDCAAGEGRQFGVQQARLLEVRLQRHRPPVTGAGRHLAAKPGHSGSDTVEVGGHGLSSGLGAQRAASWHSASAASGARSAASRSHAPARPGGWTGWRHNDRAVSESTLFMIPCSQARTLPAPGSYSWRFYSARTWVSWTTSVATSDRTAAGRSASHRPMTERAWPRSPLRTSGSSSAVCTGSAGRAA